MTKKIQSALISVFYKEGLEPVLKQLEELGVKIYSTGGTQKFIEEAQVAVTAVESLTNYPSILGGRVKTLHPSVFGGVLGRREVESDVKEMEDFHIPEIDLVIVDLYPFQETLANTNEEKAIIEKIDIGGPAMIRAAAKNFKHVVVIAAKQDYSSLVSVLKSQNGETSLEQRKAFAAKAFQVVKDYDIAISDYFNPTASHGTPLRYGENPHQQASFIGDLAQIFKQLHGKELSYNNLVDVDAAIQLINEFDPSENTFAIIKHTNVCGIASRNNLIDAWKGALAGDPESAFGGVLICNGVIDPQTASSIDSIFFEVLIANDFEPDALKTLQSKKNRILLKISNKFSLPGKMYKSILNGRLEQDIDTGNFVEWKQVGGRHASAKEQEDLIFSNIICKHLKSNAIAIVKDKQLIGKGCGQTSRIDALRQALEKARQFDFDLENAVMASDAFFPFNDCVKMGHAAGIIGFIQPGGSIRDKDSIDYCVHNGLVMVITGMRHFRH
jgi:phosphoribosylaminoimidazolecarboxamide formyltransferase/IMP cyclohydrolase